MISTSLSLRSLTNCNNETNSSVKTKCSLRAARFTAMLCPFVKYSARSVFDRWYRTNITTIISSRTIKPIQQIIIFVRKLKRNMVISLFLRSKILHKSFHLTDRVVCTIFNHGESVNQNSLEDLSASGVVVHVQKGRAKSLL